MKYPILYKKDFASADKNNEVSLYKNSLQSNTDCANAISNIMRKNYNGQNLQGDYITPIVNDFGLQRVQYVLANSIQLSHRDGRISMDNKKWAEGVKILDDEIPQGAIDHRYEFKIPMDCGIIDIFANKFRRLENELSKPSVLEQLKTNTIPNQKDKSIKPIDKEVR